MVVGYRYSGTVLHRKPAITGASYPCANSDSVNYTARVKSRVLLGFKVGTGTRVGSLCMYMLNRTTGPPCLKWTARVQRVRMCVWPYHELLLDGPANRVEKGEGQKEHVVCVSLP